MKWQSWNSGLVDRARAEGRPVYLFVGSFLSELSRATCRQTFANPEVASFLTTISSACWSIARNSPRSRRRSFITCAR